MGGVGIFWLSIREIGASCSNDMHKGGFNLNLNKEMWSYIVY